MRRTKMAVLGMMMVLSMTACVGKAEGCYLAVWTDGDYSYSVSVQTPFSQEELTGLVEQVQ